MMGDRGGEEEGWYGGGRDFETPQLCFSASASVPGVYWNRMLCERMEDKGLLLRSEIIDVASG